MNRSATLKISLLLAMLLICAVLSWMALQTVLPRTKWIDIGGLVDFPPAEQPYEIFSPEHVFVINDDNQVFILDPTNQVTGGANVNWNTIEKAFIDPNRGTWFDLRGMPYRRLGFEGRMENQSLPRYPVKIEDGMLYIDLSRTQIEKISSGRQP